MKRRVAQRKAPKEPVVQEAAIPAVVVTPLTDIPASVAEPEAMEKATKKGTKAKTPKKAAKKEKKGKKKDEPVAPPTLTERLAKRLGKSVQITELRDVQTPFATRRGTGITSMDIDLGGGLPAGSLHQVFGPEGAGKDYLTNLMIAELQRIYGEDTKVAWLSFGYWPDRSHFKLAGVDENVGHLDVIHLGDGDMALEAPTEALLESILEVIREGSYQLVVLNEVASGETKDDMAKQLGVNRKMANLATLISQFCQKFYSAIREKDVDGNPNATTLVVILPARANMDANTSKWQPYSQTAGHALKHAKAVDIELMPGGFVNVERVVVGGKKKKTHVGKMIRWHIRKGKHGISEGAEGVLNFIFHRGIDLELDLLNSGMAYGTITRGGSSYTLVNREESITGKQNVVKLLREDVALRTELKELTILAALKTKGTYDEAADPDKADKDND